MKRHSTAMLGLAPVLAVCAMSLAAPTAVQETQKPSTGDVESGAHYMSVQFTEVKWERMVPELGADSPEIAILRVDPKTQTTQLLIRNPKAMHVPQHWHTANETHTILRGTMVFECEGRREELGPGSFNYIPSKMIHQAWLPDDGMVFITVDGAWDINWVDGPPGPQDLLNRR